MVDYSQTLIEFLHDNNTIISSDRLNIVYREYYTAADLEIFEGGFTGCNNRSHAHFEALRT